MRFRLSVHTSDIFLAGTDANVYATLYDENKEFIGKYNLYNKDKDLFETNQ